MRQKTSKSFGDFRCLNCGYWVSCDRQFSGVQHRNHCPFCLWSRHLDLYQAGDRMSACKAGMRPVGLAIKTNHKKYASGRSGELMLVHLCLDCGKLSATRIAADDDVETILKVYTSSTSQQKCHHSEAGMALLNGHDSELVYQRLFGYGTALERNSIRNGPEMDYGYAPDRSICLVDS